MNIMNQMIGDISRNSKKEINVDYFKIIIAECEQAKRRKLDIKKNINDTCIIRCAVFPLSINNYLKHKQKDKCYH